MLVAAPKLKGAGEGDAVGALVWKEKPCEVGFVGGVLGTAPKEKGDALGSSFFSCAEPNENGDDLGAASLFSGALNEKGVLEAGKVGLGASTVGPPKSGLVGSAAGVEGAVVADVPKEKGAALPSALGGPAGGVGPNKLFVGLGSSEPIVTDGKSERGLGAPVLTVTGCVVSVVVGLANENGAEEGALVPKGPPGDGAVTLTSGALVPKKDGIEDVDGLSSDDLGPNRGVVLEDFIALSETAGALSLSFLPPSQKGFSLSLAGRETVLDVATLKTEVGAAGAEIGAGVVLGTNEKGIEGASIGLDINEDLAKKLGTVEGAEAEDPAVSLNDRAGEGSAFSEG